MAHLRFPLLCAAALCAGGCGGDDAGSGGAATQSISSTSNGSSSSGGGGPSGGGGGAGVGGGGGDGAGGGPTTTTVVINEISAKGEDWVELANAGTAPVDLSGSGLCDTDANGGCNLAAALRFPAGTQLAPGAYLLVVANQPAASGVGPQTQCLASGGPSTCFYATWKVSATRGETVFFVSPNDRVLARLEYPIGAAPSGQTWGRLPDLTGEPAITAPTPGAANAAP